MMKGEITCPHCGKVFVKGKLIAGPEEMANFEALWKRYPDRKGRMDALEHCLLLTRSFAATWQDLFDATVRYAAERAAKEDGMRFVQNGKTFFGRGEWWKEALLRHRNKEPLVPVASQPASEASQWASGAFNKPGGPF